MFRFCGLCCVAHVVVQVQADLSEASGQDGHHVLAAKHLRHMCEPRIGWEDLLSTSRRSALSDFFWKPDVWSCGAKVLCTFMIAILCNKNINEEGMEVVKARGAAG